MPLFPIFNKRREGRKRDPLASSQLISVPELDVPTRKSWRMTVQITFVQKALGGAYAACGSVFLLDEIILLVV